MKVIFIFLLLCLPLLANTNNIVPDVKTTTVDLANLHLQNTYNLTISKQTVLTGEIIKDFNTSLIRTYTVLKFEY